MIHTIRYIFLLSFLLLLGACSETEIPIGGCVPDNSAGIDCACFEKIIEQASLEQTKVFLEKIATTNPKDVPLNEFDISQQDIDALMDIAMKTDAACFN